jgi:hypothetical protein
MSPYTTSPMKIRIILHSDIITKITKNHSGEMERRVAKYLNGRMKFRGATPAKQSNHSPSGGISLVTLATQSNHSPTSGKLVRHPRDAEQQQSY